MNRMLRNDAHCRDDKPVCPVCDGPDCICRPRFFAGQRLTEKELNDLVGYVQNKNRLRNRHLFGWGTVCGLEASCDPCGGGLVSVSPGYALDPCGEDIVVCEPDTVDVCKLIRTCCEEPRRNDCRPHERPSACDEVEQQWILAIRYNEAPRRGILPLVKTGGGCSFGGGSGCSCGGGCSSCGSGSCFCGGGSAVKGASKIEPPRSAPPVCESGEVCEEYLYEVYPLPEPSRRRDPTVDDRRENFLRDIFCNLHGPMFERICCCVDPLFDLLEPTPQNNGITAGTLTPQLREAWFRWLCRLKKNLAAYLRRHPTFDCELFARVDAVIAPSPDLDNEVFVQRLAQALATLAVAFVEALIACICSGALPQCPPPTTDDRVPLAVVTVRGRNCEVVSVCNWTPHRRIVLTWQTMSYWFSWIPFFGQIREGLHAMCCELFGLEIPPPRDDTPRDPTGDPTPAPEGDVTPQPGFDFGVAAGPRLASANFTASGSGGFASAAFARLPRSPASMSGGDLAGALFGLGADRSRISITDDDIGAAPEFRLLSHLAAPLTAGLGPEAFASLAGPSGAPRPDDSTSDPAASDMIALRQQVDSLTRTLRAQADQIDRLNNRLDITP